MKKTLIILTALAAISLTGCSEQKNERLPEIIETTEAPTEPVFTEYNAEDFKVIEIKGVKEKNNDPPISAVRYEISEIDLLPEKPPCKSDEHKEEFYEYFYYDPDFTEEERRAAYDEWCSSEPEGEILDTALNGNELYILANYDISNHATHCFGILKYNLETKETEKLFSYSSLDELSYSSLDDSYSPSKITYCGGSVYIMGQLYSKAYVSRLNEETGELEKLPVIEPDDENGGIYNFFSEDTEELTVISNKYSEDFVVYTYNDNDQKWDEIFSRSVPERNGFFIYDFYAEGVPEKIGDDRLICHKDDNKEIYAESKSFRLNTGLRSAELAAYSDNRITFIIPDKITSILCTYDLDKMEMYKTELSGYGEDYQIYSIDSNLMIVHWNTRITFNKNLCYYIPEIGVKFDLGDFGGRGKIYSNGEAVVAFESEKSDDMLGGDPIAFIIYRSTV